MSLKERAMYRTKKKVFNVKDVNEESEKKNENEIKATDGI